MPVLTDAFLTDEMQKLLLNKYVLFVGDSVIRSMYKDFIKLLQTNNHLAEYQLKTKGEESFEHDTLLEGGQFGVMSNDLNYTEVREFKTPYHLVKCYFITRCYSDYLESICNDIRQDSDKPDVVVMNSGCWDLTRYGPNSISEYKQNLPKGILALTRVLPRYTVFIWTTTLPLAKEVRGGFMIPEIENLKSKLRGDVIEANRYAVGIILNEFKLDVIDLHYYFHNQIHRRAKDGIHWDATAHRRITNIILNHLCEAWNLSTPGRLLIKNDLDSFESTLTNKEFYTDGDNLDENNNELMFSMNNDSGYMSNDRSMPIDLFNKVEVIKRSALPNIINNSSFVENDHSYCDYDQNNRQKRQKLNSGNEINFIQNQQPFLFQQNQLQNFIQNMQPQYQPQPNEYVQSQARALTFANSQIIPYLLQNYNSFNQMQNQIHQPTPYVINIPQMPQNNNLFAQQQMMTMQQTTQMNQSNAIPLMSLDVDSNSLNNITTINNVNKRKRY